MKNFFFLTLTMFSLYSNANCLAYKLGLRDIQDSQSAGNYYPQTVEEIETRKQDFIEGFNLVIDHLLSENSRDFISVLKAYDLAFGSLEFIAETFVTVSMVHPDKHIRNYAEKACAELIDLKAETLSTKPEIYEAIDQVNKENLNEEEIYFLQEVKKELACLGLNLPKECREKAKELKIKLSDLSMQFSKNIREDRKTHLVSLEELDGMDQGFIDRLEKTEENQYILTTDYPVYFPILDNCKVEATRKKLFELFVNRAYPKNIDVLTQMSKTRHQLATLLGFNSFSHMQLSLEMVENPERVKEFLNGVQENLSTKIEQELTTLKENLPKEISLNEEGKINQWDLNYVINHCLKNLYNIDKESLRAFFPLESTLKGLLTIYEKFLDIQIQEVEAKGFWHEDVRLVKISDKKNNLLGFVTLDLFPRIGKYTHACNATVNPSIQCEKKKYPCLTTIICNFTKPTDTTPSLMSLKEMRTFFHEFGHALHAVLGSSKIISTAGTGTKTDFVELPSQMLEEWLWNKEILVMLSNHYITGEKLSEDILDSLIASKNAFKAQTISSLIYRSHYSLDLYLSSIENVCELYREISRTYRPEIGQLENNNFCLSFGHLDEYGARYYGYLWSKVFALDVFRDIEKMGLLNPEAGKKYISCIIGNGGNVDPNIMLENFLGRKPTQEAFFENIGVNRLETCASRN